MSTISPSSNQLPTITADKLRQVSLRRTRLLLLKSLAVAATTFLSVLLFAAFIDMWWNVSPSLRWGLSGTVYGFAAVAAIVSLWPLYRNWGFREAANLIEQAVPRLRNRLLAAVELAVDSDEPKFGSRSLRERLQSHVVEQIDDLQVGEVLPWKFAQRTLAIFGAVAMLVLILCLIPHLQLPQHLLRMLLPAADIARPSLADIRLIAPVDTQVAVPLNEKLLLRAAIVFRPTLERREPRFVNLEWRTDDKIKLANVSAMSADSSSYVGKSETLKNELTYSVTFDVAQATQQVRVVSDVGESIWYTLHAFPRPKVERYQIEIESPSYAKVPAISKEAPDADVEVVEGSQLSFGLYATEPLKSATIRWLDTDTTQGEKDRESFHSKDSKLWQLVTQPERTRRFQIDLTSIHGIESTFPVTYRFTVRADQSPKIQWLEPKESARVIRPKSAARMLIHFQDEFPLHSLEQWTRINRGEWSQRSLVFADVPDEQVEWTWELAALGLKLGDMIDTKIVATDRKGNVGESAVVEWIISGTELDPSREDATLAREEIADLLREWGEFSKKQIEELKELRKAWQADKPNATKEQQLQVLILSTNESSIRILEDIRSKIRQRMPRVSNLVSCEELIQLLDTLASIQMENRLMQTTWTRRAEKERLQSGNSHKATEYIDNWEERLLQSSLRTHEAYRRMVPHDILADFGRDLIDAARYQEELLRDPAQVGEEIWNREQRVLADHLRVLSREMLTHSSYLPDGPARGMSDWAGWGEQMAERMESFCAQDPPKNDRERKSKLDEVERILKELQYRSRANQLHSGLPNELIAGRRELVQLASRPHEILSKALQEWQATRNTQADASQLPPHFFDAIEQLSQRRQNHLSAGSYAALFGADLGLAYRAIMHQTEMHRGDIKKTDEVLQAIHECIAILETESRLTHSLRWLEQLQVEERFAANGKEAITENPRLWDSWGLEMEYVHDFIRRSNIGNGSADVLSALRWSPPAQAASQKLSSRRWEQKVAVSASSEIESIQQVAKEQFELLKIKFNEARERLRSFAPTIPELAREAAQLAREQQQQTDELLEHFKEGEVPNVDERLNQNADANSHERDSVSERLKDALTDLAASQNVLDQEGLQTAKTADLAQALQERAAAKREAAFENALAADEGEKANAIEQLSKRQSQEAETLDAIAAHYDQDPLAPEVTTDAAADTSLAELAHTLEGAPENLEAYEDAEKLAQWAEADPRELLRRLEQELQTNEQMQEELSDIAKKLAEQAQQSLQQAAEREKSLRTALLQSDPLREPRRQELMQEVNNALDQANRLAQRLAQEAQSQARLGKQNEEQAELQETASELYKSIDQARQQASSQLPEDMKRAAAQLSLALQEISPQLQQAAQSLAQGKQEQQFDDANKLQQAKASAERTQSQVHEQDQRYADQNVRMREQRKQAAERGVQQASQQVAQAERQRDQAREQANKNPDNESLKNALANSEADVQEKKALQSVAEQAKVQADERLNDAQQQRTALENKPGGLDAASPNTELAERLADQVAQRAAELGQSVQKMVEEATWIDEVEASREQLANAVPQQQTLQEAVTDAARDLDRAANHQARLNAPHSAQALAEAAQRVNSTANNETQQAEERLAEAGTPQDAANPRYASAAETRNATNALQDAQSSLEARAGELGTMLAAQENDAQSGAARNDSNASNDAAQAANASPPEDKKAADDAPGDAKGSKAGEDQHVANEASSESGTKANSKTGETSSPSGVDQVANNAPDANSQANSMQQGDLPLSPREMAELLDELDRQLREPSGGIKPDTLSQSANQNGPESLASLRNTQQQISQQLQQMRASAESQLNNPTMMVSREPSQARTSQGVLIPNPQGSGSIKVFSTDQLTGEPLGAWSRLREKKSEEVADSQREAVAPRYRRQIENYFRTLSERSGKQ